MFLETSLIPPNKHEDRDKHFQSKDEGKNYNERRVYAYKHLNSNKLHKG